jgi:hypothetical protein
MFDEEMLDFTSVSQGLCHQVLQVGSDKGRVGHIYMVLGHKGFIYSKKQRNLARSTI